MSELKFPLDVRELGAFLPHRAPALWLDEVSGVTAEEGVCRVRLAPAAHYADARGKVRASSFVEWIAQAYGFVAACQVLGGFAADEKKPEKTFLVQVRDFEVTAEGAALIAAEGAWLSVRVKRTHRLGPLSLVTGEVRSSQELLLARAKLKLYAE